MRAEFLRQSQRRALGRWCQRGRRHGQERQARGSSRRRIELLDRLEQRFPLPLVDLTQVENLALDHIAPSATLVLHQAPGDMMFAVFESIVTAQDQTHAPEVYQLLRWREETR